jgi:hypothetical protein
MKINQMTPSFFHEFLSISEDIWQFLEPKRDVHIEYHVCKASEDPIDYKIVNPYNFRMKFSVSDNCDI